MTPRRRLSALLTACAVMAAVAWPATASAPISMQIPAMSVPAPEDDAFYRPPSRWAHAAAGTVLRSRPVELFGPIAAVPHAAYQVLFRTNDAHDRPIAAVTTIIVPTRTSSSSYLWSIQIPSTA